MGVHRVVGILDGVFLVLSLSESLAVAVPTRRVGHRAGETWLARCYISRPERPLFLSLARDARLGILPAGPPICERCSVSYGVPLTSSGRQMERESVDDSRSKEPRPGREKWSGPSGESAWIRDKGREKAKKFPQVEVRKGVHSGGG